MKPLSIEAWLVAAQGVRVCLEQEGAVLVDVARGLVYSANSIGARIWLETSEGRSLQRVAEGLSSDYQITQELARENCLAFAGALCRHGLATYGYTGRES